MPNHDQECVEDYLELERLLAALQADQAPPHLHQLTADQIHLYQMAILLHTATPGVGDVRRAFAMRLQLQLEEELRALQQGHQVLLAPSFVHPPSQNTHLSRRGMIMGSTIAASAVVGGAGGWIVDRLTHQSPSEENISPLAWFFVATVDELGNGAIPFALSGLNGYIVRSNGLTGTSANLGQILALSAACTHKGCMVDWVSRDRTFRCPCHEAVFTEDGEVDTQTSRWLSLKPLARLEVKVEDGKISVRMPTH